MAPDSFTPRSVPRRWYVGGRCSNAKEGLPDDREDHDAAERSVPGGGRVRAHRSDRSHNQHDGTGENRALPVWRVVEQADVRRDPQQDQLSGRRGGEEVVVVGQAGGASGSTSVSRTQSSGGSGSG